ncbi:MAG TPA: hypothetical protein VFS08_18375 [Gemmatimonadaceae bacterium]|nr:hypothetical protein [Gemmatimonadaceae bacterium]
MDHRHLLPNEIDLLLDGDAGFGLAPLKAHVRACAQCQAELEAARHVVALLDDLPHWAPAPGFADRVMMQVQVFEPWHVALRDSLLRLVPASRPARLVAAAGAFVTALVVSVGAIALLGRLDLLVFGWQYLLERTRALAIDAVGGVVTAVFGDVAAAALARSSTAAIVLAAAAFLGSLIVAALLLRALTLAYRRQRS